MNVFKEKVNVSVSTLVLIALVISTLALSWLYFSNTKDLKLSNLLGGALVACFFWFVQFLLQFNDYRNNEKLSRLKIKDILDRRAGKEQYEEIINAAEKKLDILLRTGSHFLEDFCSDHSGFDVLTKKLQCSSEFYVRILLYKPKEDSEGYQEYKRNENGFVSLAQKFEHQVEIRVYIDPPAHSVLSTDSDVLVGPYFRDSKSRHTPTIRFHPNAKYTECYLSYFESVWDDAESNN